MPGRAIDRPGPVGLELDDRVGLLEHVLVSLGRQRHTAVGEPRIHVGWIESDGFAQLPVALLELLGLHVRLGQGLVGGSRIGVDLQDIALDDRFLELLGLLVFVTARHEFRDLLFIVLA